MLCLFARVLELNLYTCLTNVLPLSQCFILSFSMVVVWVLGHPHQQQIQVRFLLLPARSPLLSGSMTSVAYRYWFQVIRLASRTQCSYKVPSPELLTLKYPLPNLSLLCTGLLKSYLYSLERSNFTCSLNLSPYLFFLSSCRFITQLFSYGTYSDF